MNIMKSIFRDVSKIWISKLAVISLCALVTVSCGGSSSSGGTTSATTPPPSPPPPPPPSGLSVADLTGSAVPGLDDMEYLQAPSDAAAPFSTFSGSLTFSETYMTTAVRSEFDGIYNSTNFPGFSIELHSDGDDIFPVQRGLISTWGSGASFWDVVVGAGKIWVESDDGAGWHRASIPITLVSRRVGQARNCVAIFLYTTTTVSKSYIQCSQETSPSDDYTPGDMRTLTEISYTPGTIANAAQETTEYRGELVDRLAVRPWSEIQSSDPDLIGTFNRDSVPADHQSLGALVIDDVIYRQAPLTRHGPYPYPEDMRHGVYSVTKSMSGGLSLLYLAERYGDVIFDALITDYVPGLSGHPGWQGVTFEHTINMATGVTGGDDGGFTRPFIRAFSADEGIAEIANLDDATPAPGEEFNYASTNFFVLSFAMQQYVEAREGPGVSYWDLVDENVLKPIGIPHFPIQKSLEPDGALGIPTMGWGAYPTADDTAKIAILFKNEGAHNGVQLLHLERTREATNKTSWPGYDVGDGRSYKHSFWINTFNFNGCSFDVSYMLGHGANYVVLAPSGIIVIRYMDYNKYGLAPLMRAAESVRSSC